MGGGISKVFKVFERVIFPPLLIEDAVLSIAKSEFHHAQKDLQDAISDYQHQVTLGGNEVSDMHTKLTKVQFIVGTLKNQPKLELPDVDLSKFNNKGWKIAETVTDIAIQVAALISLVLPEPVGLIAAIVIPIVGDIIKEGEEIGKYKSATKTMKHNLTIVTSNRAKVASLRTKIKAESVDLDKFNDDALKTIGKADWSKVQDEVSLKFNESLNALSTATPDTIKDLADQLLKKEDRDKIIKIWNAKEKLDSDIASIR